ncbi:MAG: aminopeptidase P family protein [Ilumatobacteraceae bacterium]
MRARFDQAEAFLVSDLTNIRWLTGFTGSNGWVLMTPTEIVLLTDGRYGDQATAQLTEAGVAGRVVVRLSSAAMLDALAAEVALFATIGFESEHVTYEQFQRFQQLFKPDLVPVSGVVEAARRKKDAGEVARMVEACRIADAALAEVVALGLKGRTEAQVRNRLEIRMRELGADGPSYETIVATGPVNAARPHHRPTDTVIEAGHTVIIDVGALFDGYHSDMTRTFFVGESTAQQRELYEVVLAAQCAGVAAVEAGLSTAELDGVCRDAITRAGFGEWFSHGTGHGVGLVIHEDPFINHTGDLKLQVGDVVTVEPGVYREGFGGIRVEDLVVVTDDGCRVLTASPKDSPCPPSPPTT